MKIAVVERESVKRVKLAKAARAALKEKASPNNKDIAEICGQILDIVLDLKEEVK